MNKPTRGEECRRRDREVADTCWVQTASGGAFDLLSPTPDQVSARDIAEHLAKIPRFVGATPNVVFSVAQHSIIVAEALPLEARAYGLLHDAHEAYLGDDSAPKLRAMTAVWPGAREAIARLRHRADAAIHTAFGLPWPLPPGVAEIVQWSDLRSLATEKRDHMAREPRPWVPLPKPFPRSWSAWPWPKAAERFLDALKRYCPTVPE